MVLRAARQGGPFFRIKMRRRPIIHLLHNVLDSQDDGIYLINEKDKLCRGFLVDVDEELNVFRFLANGFSAILDINVDDIYTIWMHSDSHWRISLNKCVKVNNV